VRRSWKRRWFVVEGGPDYRVSYFKSPGDRQPKGGLILQGYEVRPDCFKSEKDLCIELYHRSRRCFYVFADTREGYAQWIPILKEVCRSARHELHPDPLCVRAFNVAYGATQLLMEDHTNRPPEVSETDALVELVCDRIDHIVLGDAFLAEQDSSHIKMSRRRFASFTSKKFVVATVLHAVVPTLQSVHDQADYLRHRLKAELRTVWPEFTRAEDEFNERIEEVRCGLPLTAATRAITPTNLQQPTQHSAVRPAATCERWTDDSRIDCVGACIGLARGLAPVFHSACLPTVGAPGGAASS
jgi:hypothetical protein